MVSVICALDTRGKPLFVQQRMGRNNVPFLVFKFRTMNVAAPREVATHKLENPDQYISRVGETLRKLSIDELPQLINVLIGNMSIVGPRPVVLTETDLIALRKRNGANSIRRGYHRPGADQRPGQRHDQGKGVAGRRIRCQPLGLAGSPDPVQIGGVCTEIKGICEGANPRISTCREKDRTVGLIRMKGKASAVWQALF